MAQDGKQTGPSMDTVKDWNGPDDARNLQGAGDYPNYWSHKTRSGHVFMLDDSKGSEHVTLQHRSGSMVQFMPDGAVQFIAHKGKYTFTFGEDRVEITGASDVRVKGAASLRVEKNYELTVLGDMNLNVTGKLRTTAQKLEQLIAGDIETEAKNRTEKIVNNINQTAGSAQYIATKEGAITVAAFGDTVAIGAAKKVGIAAGDQVMLRSANKTSIKSKNADIQMEAQTDVGVQTKAGKIALKAQGGDIGIQTDKNLALQTGQSLTAKSGQLLVLNSDSTAYLKGGSSVQIKGSPNVTLNGDQSEALTPAEPGQAADAKTDTDTTGNQQNGGNISDETIET